MTCMKAVVKAAVTVTPDHTVEKALDALRKAGVSYAPVIEGKALAGWFSVRGVLESAISVSVNVSDRMAGVKVALPNAPGMDMRLKKVLAGRVEDIMERPEPLRQQESLDSAVKIIAERGEPAAAVADDSGLFLGVVTGESALHALLS